MMLVLLFRILILLAIIILIYTFIQYLQSPRRKMQIAQNLKQFYFIDEPNNSKKNLQFTYKGCLFEGEKYLGTTENAFEVLNIHVSVHEPLDLKGFTREDIYFMEKELLIRYPHARIIWQHPVNQILLTNME